MFICSCELSSSCHVSEMRSVQQVALSQPTVHWAPPSWSSYLVLSNSPFSTQHILHAVCDDDWWQIYHSQLIVIFWTSRLWSHLINCAVFILQKQTCSCSREADAIIPLQRSVVLNGWIHDSNKLFWICHCLTYTSNSAPTRTCVLLLNETQSLFWHSQACDYIGAVI